MVRSLIKNRLTTNADVKDDLDFGGQRSYLEYDILSEFCDFLNDRCRRDIGIKTRGN